MKSRKKAICDCLSHCSWPLAIPLRGFKCSNGPAACIYWVNVSGVDFEETGDYRKSEEFIDASGVKLSRDGPPIRLEA